MVEGLEGIFDDLKNGTTSGLSGGHSEVCRYTGIDLWA